MEKMSDQEIRYRQVSIRRLESNRKCYVTLFFAMAEKWTSYKTVHVVT